MDEAPTRKRMGRPPKPQREVSRIEIRVPPDLRHRVYVAAAQMDMPIGVWVQRAIEEKLQRDGRSDR